MKKALILLLLVFSASLSGAQDRTAPITKVDWKEIGKFSRSHPDSIKVLISRMLCLLQIQFISTSPSKLIGSRLLEL